MKRKITYLDPVPVRYSGSVPNLSRRGGVRVHPIKDGGLNPAAAQEQLRFRDRSGNKLRDVIDRNTGFVKSVVSAIESVPNYGAGMDKPVRPAVSGSASGTLKMLPAEVLVDSAGNRVYLDEDGKRIRTLDMGEEPVGAVCRRAAPDGPAKTTKRGRSVETNGANGASPKPTRIPGTATGSSRITESDVIGFLSAMYRQAGKPVPKKFTAGQLADAKVVLKARMAQARKILGS